MTIPSTPIPSISDLLCTFNAPPFTGDRWLVGRKDCVVRLYDRGRDSLAAGIQAVRRQAGRNSISVWFPGYFCNEALDPVRVPGVSLNFYPVREDLSPDWVVIEQYAVHESVPQVFILVHYFGFPSATKRARELCDRQGIVLLEDAAHLLLPCEGVGSGDLLVFSPRKLLAVPSGGILIVSRQLSPNLVDDLDYADVKETLGWIVRRVAQQILLRLHLPWHYIWGWRQAIQQISGNGSGPANQRKCRPFAVRLLAVMERDLDQVIRQRRLFYNRLLDLSSHLGSCRPLFPVLPEGVCPYAFPLLLNRGSLGVVERLRSRGIPAERWADLPPEVLADPEQYETAIRIRDRLLLLPVHQSVSQKQMDVVQRALSAEVPDRS